MAHKGSYAEPLYMGCQIQQDYNLVFEMTEHSYSGRSICVKWEKNGTNIKVYMLNIVYV